MDTINLIYRTKVTRSRNEKERVMFAFSILSAFTLMGCGEQLHEMTEEEEVIR